MGRVIRIGRVGGVRLGLDWTVLFIFALVVANLGLAALPAWHPTWSPTLVWTTAAAAGVAFLASILAHELAHALVGRALGVSVRSITLFIFGGVTDIEREPRSPRVELLMAVVGPLTSLGIGVACTAVAGGLLRGTGVSLSDPAAALAALGPFGTLLAWLGPLNIVLGVFNLVPGFPLDGGRIVRAALWAVTGNLHTATRWAARLGQLVAWTLIFAGVAMIFGARVPIFGRGVAGGLWIALIGWFLSNAASTSYRQLLVRDLLEGVPVSRLTRWPETVVPPDATVARVVDEWVGSGRGHTFAVMLGERLLGLLCFADLRLVPRRDWATVRVSEVMKPASRLVWARSGEDLYQALEQMGRHGFAQLPVLDDGAFAGLLRREDIGRWMALQLGRETPPPTPTPRPPAKREYDESRPPPP